MNTNRATTAKYTKTGIRLGCTAILASFLSSSFVHAQDVGGAQQHLENASDDVDSPRKNAVVRLMPGDGTNGCTATLVAPDLLLTAGHCLTDGRLYKLQNKKSGRFLAVAGAQRRNGANVIQWDDVGQRDIKWQPIPEETGYYKLKNRNSGRFLVVSGGKKSDGADVIQWEDNDQKDIWWRLEYAGDGYYKFRNRKSSKYLAVSGGHTRKGADIIQWKDQGQEDIFWRPVHVGDDSPPRSGITIYDEHNWELPSRWYDIEGGGITVGFGADRSGVAADSDRAGSDEIFTVRGGSGGIRDGNTIQLETSIGRYVVAESGGGNFVGADRGAGPWQTFVVEKVGGSGLIRDSDRIALRANNGQYVVAEGGGGGIVNANRPSRGRWETFVIELQGGSGNISYDDDISLRARNGDYIAAKNGGAGEFLAKATEYSIAGFADVMVMRLDRDVPRSVAIPMPALTNISGDESRNRDVRHFLRDKSYRMVGYGGAGSGVLLPRYRQTASADFHSYPVRGEPIKMLVKGVANSVPQPGDSGSPLLWTNPRTGRETVVAVNQGFEGDRGRYTLTFYGGGKNGNRPNIGLWLQEAMDDSDCAGIDPDKIEVRRIDGRWKLVQGDDWIEDFARNEGEARKALWIVRHYGINRQCFIDRPDSEFIYYLVGNDAPDGHFASEDCVRFNPSNLGILPTDKGWTLLDSRHSIIAFHPDGEPGANEAQVAIQIIRSLGANHLCFIGRPDPSTMYLRR